MQPLYLIAVISPRADRIDEARSAFARLVQSTLAEPGCEVYDLVTSPDDPTTWLMLEKWSTREAWEAHMRTSHVIAHNAEAESFLTCPAELRFYDPI